MLLATVTNLSVLISLANVIITPIQHSITERVTRLNVSELKVTDEFKLLYGVMPKIL